MPPKKKTRTTSIPDVRKPADLKALLDVVAAHPITIILIHADYCGHCQTYKKNVWNKLSAVPNKKNGMASIHYDQVEGTPFADAKIKGYPSVIIVGKKKMAEFEDEEKPEEMTNAMPMDEANNEEKMKTLVTSAEPSTLMGTVKNIKTNVDAGPEESSPELTEEAKTLRETKGDTPDTVSLEQEEDVVSPPDVRSDVLNSQKKAPESLEFTPEQANEAPRPGKGAAIGGSAAAIGGSLYSSLLEAARAAGPAVALTAAAVAMGRRKSRKGKQARKVRKTRKGRAGR